MLEQRITGANSLPSIVPDLSPNELIKQLLPPPEFAKARFESYRPDANFPSQQQAVEIAKQFVTGKRAKLFAKTSTATRLANISEALIV